MLFARFLFLQNKKHIYKNHFKGSYVRSKPNLCTPDITIKYIRRYLGHSVIVISHIDKYDGKFVTFHYTQHEDSNIIEE